MMMGWEEVEVPESEDDQPETEEIGAAQESKHDLKSYAPNPTQSENPDEEDA
jgi:hypothetical protein